MVNLPTQTTRELARELEVPEEAVQATRNCETIDLHIDTFIPVRLWGYDITRQHRSLPGGFFGHHLDLPRMANGGLAAAMWSVTTNPVRTRNGRWKTAKKNFQRLRSILPANQVQVVSCYKDYQKARARGLHVALFSIQGGNALDGAPSDTLLPDPDILRVTLVHLTNSNVGESSQPIQVRHQVGLTNHGREIIERLNHAKVFVDLAHISRRAFWEALEAHEPSQPVLVTHTGIDAIHPHWRNIDDDQIRAVAATGGSVGIMFHRAFLAHGRCDVSTVIDHAAHVINVAGEDHVSIGSDYDGAITPPRDLASGDSYPRLVAEMLRRRFSETRIEKLLGGNFLRAFRQLRPDS